jgi:aminoglycoside phosphotransferase (APT) family kinase protein
VEAAIARYLTPRLPGCSDMAITNLFRIPGGASRETWMFDAAWTEDGQPRSAEFVLRKDPPASLVESDRLVEYSFYDAFHGSSVPVPRMRWLESDPAHLGGEFFIMDRITGCDSNTRRILEPDYNDSRDALARQMYEVLAAVHALDWTQTPIAKVTEAPAPDACWKHELDYWEGMIEANELSPQPIARAAIRWLRANPPPPPARVSVVHGDYRVGNFLYTKSGIEGVVDWEMAHLGDPIEDLAWSFMELWEFGGNGKKGGIISADDAIAAYEAAGGVHADRDALHWWDVFSGVKGQGIWLTGARSFQDGRSQEMMLAYTSWGLINRQDEILLRSLGRGA